MSDMKELVERLARPGLLGVVGQALEKRCRRDLEAYFKVLGRRVVGLELGKLAEQDNAETARHAVVMKLGNILRIVRPLLVGALQVNIAHAMLTADKQDVFSEAIVPSGPPTSIPPFDMGDGSPDEGPDKLGLSGQEASDYAAEQAAKSVSSIDATTTKLIADAVAQGIKERLGVEGTARLIRAVVVDMTRQRSELIAQWEIGNAMSEAAFRKMKRLDIQYKQVILSDDPCPICEENADEDPLPIDELYPSGDLRSPFHPRCRCGTTGARPPTAELPMAA